MEEVWKDINLASIQDHETASNNNVILQDFLARPFSKDPPPTRIVSTAAAADTAATHSKPIWQRKGAGALVLIFRRIPLKNWSPCSITAASNLSMSCALTMSFDSFWNLFDQRSFLLLFFALFFRKSPQCFSLFFFSLDIKSTVCDGGHDNEAGRERKKKEVGRGERNDEFFNNI
jgi:hypothetical protein